MLTSTRCETVKLSAARSPPSGSPSSPHEDRDNTRVKDLADVVLFISQGLDSTAAHEATRHVFTVRDTHPIPKELPDPPEFWNEDYAAFSEELDLAEASLDLAMATLRVNGL
jgi:hypothetical protein